MKIPEGWPTEEMIEAGCAEFRKAFWWTYYSSINRVDLTVKVIFQAMLTAAPTDCQIHNENAALKSENFMLVNERDNSRNSAQYLINENRKLRDEVERLKKELSVTDIAQECLNADKEEE